MAMSLPLSAQALRALQALAADVTRVFRERMIAVVAYAPTRAAVFTETLEPGDLDALSVLTETWHRAGLDTPLLLTAVEFRRSLDAFPLEYQAILDRHVVIAGTPPFDGAGVPADELRRACEAQAKGHLIHLRQAWIDAAGHGDQLAEKLAMSALPLRALLSQIARLNGDGDIDAATAASRLGADADILRAVLALEAHPDDARALLPRLPQYLAACEHVWTFVDEWRAQ
jgi:hypothetical protein